jgi:uncharacterized membrane protein YccC
VSLAEWLRSLALGKALAKHHKLTKTRLSPKQLDALRHLGWIGNNLNQLARQMNIAAKEQREIQQAYHALDDLSSIANDIRKIREAVLER